MTVHEREIKTSTTKERENALLKNCFDVGTYIIDNSAGGMKN